MQLAWGTKVPPEFSERVIQIASSLGCDPSWLMACMHFETGGTFDPAKRNPSSGATGLIQFMPSTARGLGTTTDELARMTQVQQLEYVLKYFQPYVGRLPTLSDTYMAILWPVAVGAPEDSVIFSSGSQAYALNRGLDLDRDQKVTKAECTRLVAQRLEEGLRPRNAMPITPSAMPVPIEERGVPARPEDQDRLRQEQPMAPIAFILPLLQSLFQVFTPIAQAKLTQALNKQTENPEMSAAMAQQILDIVKQAAGQIPGVMGVPTPTVSGTTTPAATSTGDAMLSAATAIEKVKSNPALVAKVETDVVSYLERMSPVLDKLSQMEQAAWAAEDASRDAAARRTAALVPGEWRSPPVIIAFAMLGLPYIAVARVLFSDGVFSEQLQTVVVTAAVTGIIGYIGGYFFGTTRSNTAKDVVIADLANRPARVPTTI